jgi:SAM-dependent methyltransferase
MPAYEQIAAFYDVVMDDPSPRAARVDAAIDRYRPQPATLLELGCGTGSILARLETTATLTGLDRSPEMLAIAAAKVPGAQLLEGDMADFDLGRRFDVVACVFDSINHLLDVASWASLLECVHRHLADDGLFVFDVNTVGELHRLGEELPWIYDFGGGTAIIDVTFALDPAGCGVTDWDIRIFERVADTRYELHHEKIGELALPLARVRELVADRFELLEEVDEDGLPAADTSVKAYYALRRKG